MVTLLLEQGNRQDWCCLSTDTKPTVGVKNGALMTEIDGGATYRFNEESLGWIESTQTKFLRSIAVDISGCPDQFIGFEPDFTGIAVTATYSDTTTADVTDYADIYAPDEWVVAENTVLVRYNDGEMVVEKDVTVTAAAQALASVAVKTAPDKLEYEAGAKFKPAGLVVTATYNNGNTEDIAYPDDALTFSPDTNTALTAEDTAVTITLTIDEVAKTATQAITVSEPAEE